MNVPAEQIIELLQTLAIDEKMQVTIKQSVRAGFIAGVMATLGGLIGGPPGIVIGGTLGGCIAAASSTRFESVVVILREMEPDRKEHLAAQVRRIMGNIGAADVAVLAGMIGNNIAVRNEIANALINYLREEMQMQIANR